MADRLSALANLPASDAGDARVALTEARPGSILQVQAWSDTVDAARAALAVLLGAPAPALGHAATANGIAVAAVAPGRFLVSAEAAGAAECLAAILPPAQGAVTDISHGRVVLRLEGEAAAELLSRCVAIDLDPAVFPPGRVAQTAIHHIDVLVHRIADSRFDLWALRSFAEALAEWLLDAGAELGAGFQR